MRRLSAGAGTDGSSAHARARHRRLLSTHGAVHIVHVALDVDIIGIDRTAMADDKNIIIIKKKGGHAGHHGGAWKVAYADFVTAMMAFFLVMWLMGSSKPVQDAVGGYFRDPKGTEAKKGNNLVGPGDIADLKKHDPLAELETQVKKAMEKMSNFDQLKKQIEMTDTPEGLRIEMVEDAKGTFFENGKAEPTKALDEVLKILAAETGKLPNPVSIEGHTDSKPYANSASYSNWELSTDRANAARRLMTDHGLRPDQVVQVRGFADHNLRNPSEPEDPSNRRITIIVQYMPKTAAPSMLFDGTVPVAHQMQEGALKGAKDDGKKEQKKDDKKEQKKE